jgi:hypothetical protein
MTMRVDVENMDAQRTLVGEYIDKGKDVNDPSKDVEYRSTACSLKPGEKATCWIHSTRQLLLTEE